MSGLSWYLGASPEINEQQNLLISTSKHVYLNKDGFLRRQQKAIDPRLPGAKTLVTRMIAYDQGSGAFYAELHERGQEDVLSFLARTWWKKPDHFMHGVPMRLNIPRASMKDKDHMRDISLLQDKAGFIVGPLPSGYAAGAVAARLFEARIEHVIYAMEGRATLDVVRKFSAMMSYVASSSSAFFALESWGSVNSAPMALFDMIDGEYTPAGAWRKGWEYVLQGLPKTMGD